MGDSDAGRPFCWNDGGSGKRLGPLFYLVFLFGRWTSASPEKIQGPECINQGCLFGIIGRTVCYGF